MKKNTSGYDAGKKAWGEMCGDVGRMSVKAYSRGGAVKKVAVKAMPKSVPKPPVPAAAIVAAPVTLKRGGVVKKADGGAVGNKSDKEKGISAIGAQSGKEKIRSASAVGNKSDKEADGYKRSGKVKKMKGKC